MNYHAKFQGKILQNIDFIKCLVSYVFFFDHGVLRLEILGSKVMNEYVR